MSAYRRGAVLGLTVAETFILLTFLLLIALLWFIQQEESPPEHDPDSAPSAPVIWVRPEEIETLTNMIVDARRAEEWADQARVQAQKKSKEARQAEEEAKQALATAERERDQAHETTEEARKAAEEAEQVRAAAERDRDQAQHDLKDLALLHRKGKNPPCWYEVVSTGEEGETREKPHYVFDVAVYEDSIELAPREPPPGGAFDDDGGPYANEWKRLRIGELPYGEKLSNKEFVEAISDLVAQGRNRHVRTYECVFSVSVWDMTPEHAKKRWKDAHHNIIEGSFSSYIVQNTEWKGAE